MGIGVLEVLIVLLIILVLFGGYKRLPALGRSAGSGVRKGGEKAKQIAGQVQEKAEGVDGKKIGESVGKGLREARDVRDSVKGIASDEPAKAPAGSAQPAGEPGEPAEKPAAERPTES